MNPVQLAPMAPPKTHDFNPANRLHLKFLLVMTGIIAVAFIGQILVQREIATQDFESQLVAVATTQRAVCERLCKIALASQSSDGLADTANELPSQLNDWKRVHETLKGVCADPVAVGTAVGALKNRFDQMEPSYQAFGESVHAVAVTAAEHGDPHGRDDLRSLIDRLLPSQAKYLKGMGEVRRPGGNVRPVK